MASSCKFQSALCGWVGGRGGAIRFLRHYRIGDIYSLYIFDQRDDGAVRYRSSFLHAVREKYAIILLDVVEYLVLVFRESFTSFPCQLFHSFQIAEKYGESRACACIE